MTGPSPATTTSTVLISAPSQIWSGFDGNLDSSRQGSELHGMHHADWRYLSELTWSFAEEGTLLAFTDRTTTAEYTWALRAFDETKNPRHLVHHRRNLTSGELVDHVTVTNASSRPLTLTVTAHAVAAISPLHEIRSGTRSPSPMRREDRGGPSTVGLTANGRTCTVNAPDAVVTVEAADPVHHDGSGTAIRMRWDLTVAAGASSEVLLQVTADDPGAVVARSPHRLRAVRPTGVPDLDRWCAQAVADLDALLLVLRGGTDTTFAAAGAPWYLTLFGRDSLWTALFVLPHDPSLAWGTARALAEHQGTRVDEVSCGAPGKILHELRADPHEVPREALTFPPVYYGSVDATALWVHAVAEAWRTTRDRQALDGLSAAVRAALTWLLDQTAEGSFMRYHDVAGTGLANQGWKDSSDAVVFHDGHLATGPVALCEVQGYAYRALLDGAELFDVLSVEGADELRARAAALRERFRDSFWVEVGGRRYPALALDADGEAVDSLTSNAGHLIGTGLLTEEEELTVADLMVAPDMLSGYGVRTLSTTSAGYWPLSYHCGSVWAHDTAIILAGMQRSGLTGHAEILARQLLSAARALGGRMPELIGGQDATLTGVPVEYPTACRPQAWSAAAVFPVVRSLAT
ncbi:glycogen debranching N-terminal domain-containing protein [Myceligenerans indicum]|uniref:Amylo-alpha-1,6-glucosidase n=1 Tax=Myceligenerans indicum TaxID=2593663 RepID=A0ABS1LMK3_9MICO|nr:glycogen debranching N-terminal domain-containing protein [Myceligenerans indicum]MBL0887505.1 amylo-alpha-1,6-glucosidase [Myceligenerans indicum]